MAVPEFLRNSRTMQVYIKARKILIHTRQIIASEKNIPKRHQRRMDRRSITRERRKIKKLAAKIGDGELPERKLTESYQSWRSHARHGNTKSIVHQMDRLFCAALQAARKEKYHEQDHRTGAGKRPESAACAECGA